MHKTLNLRVNGVFILCEIVVLGLFLLPPSGRVALSCATGAILGCWAGVLQARVLRAKPDAFAATSTALDVRRLMAVSHAGKLSIALGWLSVMLVLLSAVSFRPISLASAPLLAGYFAFMLLRDLIAYPALRSVNARRVEPFLGT